MLGMYGKEVCILQKGDKVVLQCFMQCINCSHCPPGNKTPFLFCLSQLFRINHLLLVYMPSLSDTDVLDHPGLNTSILESSTSSTFIQITTIHVFLQSLTSSTFIQITTIHVFLQSSVFDIRTNNYNTCIFTIFDVFDIRTNNYNTCIFTIFDVFDIRTNNYNTCIFTIFDIFIYHKKGALGIQSSDCPLVMPDLSQCLCSRVPPPHSAPALYNEDIS